MEELPQARVVEQSGFVGCAHARPNGGNRQVLLVDVESALFPFQAEPTQMQHLGHLPTPVRKFRQMLLSGLELRLLQQASHVCRALAPEEMP